MSIPRQMRMTGWAMRRNCTLRRSSLVSKDQASPQFTISHSQKQPVIGITGAMIARAMTPESAQATIHPPTTEPQVQRLRRRNQSHSAWLEPGEHGHVKPRL